MMTVTNEAYEAWLQGPVARRMVLVEAEYSGGTEYISSGEFISEPTDTPPNKCYDELLTGSVAIDGSLERSTSVGGIQMVNDGSLDSWLSRNWLGYSLRVYLGDASWDRDDFRLVVDGINGGIEQAGAAAIEFTVYDRMRSLSTPLQEAVLSDGGNVPVCLGQVFNVPPALSNAATGERQVNDGPVVSIVVRDNGVDITGNCTLDLSNGKFTPNAAVVGQLTCDVVEQHQTLAQMAEFIATRYGESVDAANLAAFPVSSPLGYYTRDSVSGDQVLTDLAASLGAYPRFSLQGELQLLYMDFGGTPVVTLDENEILLGGLELQEVQQPAASVVVRYQKNWSTQSADALAGSVSDANRDLYSRDFSSVEATNAIPSYKIPENREVDSYIVQAADAQVECDRRAALRSIARERWRVRGFLSSVGLSEGDTVAVSHPDFGFEAGREGVVLSIDKNLLADNVELEVLI